MCEFVAQVCKWNLYRKINFHCKNNLSELSIQLFYILIASTVHFEDVNKVSLDVAFRNVWLKSVSELFFYFCFARKTSNRLSVQSSSTRIVCNTTV